jgi:pSer/pThr/pTyr-binding forkhead associated (FHA) protein
MLEVLLTVGTGEDSQTIVIDEYRTTFGRGSDAVHRFEDAGLSRLNSTIYRDGDNVWIVDENSTNGTLINGSPAASAGTPLNDGDTIKIGNSTEISVSIKDPVKEKASNAPAKTVTAASAPQKDGFGILPLALIGFAFFVILASMGVIGFVVFGGEKQKVVIDDPIIARGGDSDAKSTPTPKTSGSISDTTSPGGDSSTPEQLPGGGDAPVTPTAPDKKYAQMSDTEKRDYIAGRAMRIAQLIGNSSAEKIPPEAVSTIKADVDAYVKRLNAKVLTGQCRMGGNLQATYDRARANAPFIIRAFNTNGVDPVIGLYLAMIESEHCPCLQSGTGPLGMFQFARATAQQHGLDAKAGASPTNPDERCEPEPAAKAAASYMKALMGRFGTGPSSVPLAIASYNSGEGGLSSNLVKALSADKNAQRDFWTLVANTDKLSSQFQSENFKYVPKFFATAIIGENPQDFGLNLQPLSTYTK